MADNLSHEYQLENPMIGERKVITKKTWLLLTHSEYICSQSKALYTILKLLIGCQMS